MSTKTAVNSCLAAPKIKHTIYCEIIIINIVNIIQGDDKSIDDIVSIFIMVQGRGIVTIINVNEFNARECGIESLSCCITRGVKLDILPSHDLHCLYRLVLRIFLYANIITIGAIDTIGTFICIRPCVSKLLECYQLKSDMRYYYVTARMSYIMWTDGERKKLLVNRKFLSLF